MAYKTCDDCGSRIFEYGCVNCFEEDYIAMQDYYNWLESEHENELKIKAGQPPPQPTTSTPSTPSPLTGG